MSVAWTYLSPTRQGGPAQPKGKAALVTAETGIPRLIDLFLAWKVILFAVALASPGPGYDTSTDILLAQTGSPATSTLVKAVEYVVLRLTRWDAIYFASGSARGHVYEQEWAFSWVLSKITHVTATGAYHGRKR